MPVNVSRFEPKKILCAVDLSPMSGSVLKWARLFVENYRAQLEVVHAAWEEYPPYFLPSQEEQLAAEAKQRRATLGQRLAALTRDALGPGISPETAILDGHPAEALLARAASAQPELIVMGSHGHSGFSRLRLGSVAETVLRTTRVPALIARTRADAQTPKISRVLCPVNFTEDSRRCLTQSAEVAASFRAQLVVVHAVEEGSIDLNARHEELCRWVPSEARKQCNLVEMVRHGNAAEQILLAAREQSADLIILGAERHSFLDLAILSTTAERVVRHAECAVLVLPGQSEFAA